MRMRVERLHKMIEMEYACHLKGVMKYSDKRGCMNIIRIYERRMRELLGFYVFGNMGNEINLLLNLSGGICATFIYIRTSNDKLENGAEISSRTKGMQGDLKMGDR